MIGDDGLVRCDGCGVVLEVGMHPFCPHGAPRGGIIPDGIPGGMVIENLGRHPVRVDSMTEYHRIRESQGLLVKEKFCPTPGTDIDPAGIPNPKGYVSPKTLEDAAILLCRAHQKDIPFDADAETLEASNKAIQEAGLAVVASEPVFDPVESGVVRNFFEGHLTERDAIAISTGDPRRSSRVFRRIHGSDTDSQ